MTRSFDPVRGIQTAVAAMEDDSPAAVLTYYVTEFSLPAKVVAAHAGLSIQMLYNYADADGGIRPTHSKVEGINRVVERLKTLEAQGLLELSGTAAERAAQLNDLLTVDETPK